MVFYSNIKIYFSFITGKIMQSSLFSNQIYSLKVLYILEAMIMFVCKALHQSDLHIWCSFHRDYLPPFEHEKSAGLFPALYDDLFML